MRTLLLASAALSATLLQPVAGNTCGMSPPQVLMVTSHQVRSGTGEATRTFVLLDQPASGAAYLAWRVLDPASYDQTAVAGERKLDSAMSFSLVGPAGVEAVSSKRALFVREASRRQSPSQAIEIARSAEGFTIAVGGKHTGLGWTALDAEADPDAAELTSWLADHSIVSESGVTVARIHGSPMEVISFWADGGEQTVVRNGDELVTRCAGRTYGLLAADRYRYLVVQRGDHLLATYL